jgi:probable rRNA maturation factor
MFEIFNETDRKIEELKVLNDYVKYVVKKLELEKCEFNIIIVDNEKIHEINKEYRNIDRETDVISFALEDEMDVEYVDFRLLGDIYISHDRVISQAKEYGHSELREICFLATHGILHLLGYDHMEPEDEKEMFKLQNELLDGYNIKRD